MLAGIFAKNRNCTTSDWHHDGPYKINKILMKGKVEMVTIDQVKPAHFEREPESGKMTQRQTKRKSMIPNPVTIARGPRWNRVRFSSTFTPQSDTTRAHLARPPTPYKAPQSKTPIVSRADGNSSGLWTYSRVPLHLRSSTLDQNKTNVSSSNNTADSDKVKSDNTVKHTRVGRKIHTPANSYRWSKM